MPAERKKWTPDYLDRISRKMQPNDPRIELTDPGSEGLIARITHKGVRFSAVYRVTGQGGFNPKTGRELKGPQQRVVIGRFPNVGLSEARAEADKIRDMADKGEDPKERQLETAEAKRAAAEQATREAERQAEERRKNSAAVVVEGFLAYKQPRLKPKTHTNLKNLMKKHVLPGFEENDIEVMADITAVRVNKLLNSIELNTGWNTATKVKNAVRTLIEYSIDNGHMEHDPRPNIKKMEGKNPQPKKEAEAKNLSTEHQKVIWNRAKSLGYPWGRLVQLVMLTGCRIGELRDAKWSEIDFENRALLLTKGRSKNKQTVLVPFSDRAWQIIESLPRGNRGEFMFSTTSGEKPLNSNTYAKDLINRGISKEYHGWWNHDLRHTFRTKLSAFKVPPHIAELAISHKLTGIEATYNHHDFLDEKREAAELYSQFIGGLDE